MPDLFRPLPATSRRDQWRARVASVGPARLVTGAGSVVAVAVAAWWLLRAPTPPVEAGLPRATSSRTTVARAGTTTSTTAPRPPGGPTTVVPHAAVVATTAAGSSGSTGSSGSSGSSGSPPSPPATIVAQVAGKVARPGVYHLPVEARVVDLIDAAGGVVADGDAGGVALAAHLADGQRIVVPAVGERVPPLAADAGASPGTGIGPGAASPSAVATPDDPVDLNTATAADLDRLPGVGPATAAAILAYRDAHGPFRTVDDLGEVRGIGPARLDALRALVRV